MILNKANKILVIIFLLINGIVLYNAVFHTPWIGYDGGPHVRNIVILSEFRLPSKEETYMFYMPPLTYFLPAMLYATGRFSLFIIFKIAQLFNVACSIGLTFYLLKICAIIRPNNTPFKILSLSFLGMLPVYYKTFAFIRGEPILSFLTVFAIYKTLIIFVKKDLRPYNIIVLGITFGLMILTRQTAFFTFPAIFIFVAISIFKDRQKWKSFFVATVCAFLIAFIVGGWFYMHLRKTSGKVVAYNVPPKKGFSFSNQPLKFYLGLGNGKLFADPIRKAFPNQFFPIFYSEVWGDYLCYFNVYGKIVKDGKFIEGLALEKVLSKNPSIDLVETNRYTIGRYLGRVNFVSLFPSGIIWLGLVVGVIYLAKTIID
ncbi:MAG: glycosyltransferase family 39 protein, partial [Candidatus Omnitrophica bacterium]|nr:glycosyltransferase family 39 protein [Candidatus Omnitrophota bacterium]